LPIETNNSKTHDLFEGRSFEIKSDIDIIESIDTVISFPSPKEPLVGKHRRDSKTYENSI